MEIVISKNGIPIRLTEERWFHITENHEDLAGYYDDVLSAIEDPDYIIEGYGKVLVALTRMTKTRLLAVVYKEVSKEDGFIVTAYFTSKLRLEREVVLWRKK